MVGNVLLVLGILHGGRKCCLGGKTVVYVVGSVIWVLGNDHRCGGGEDLPPTYIALTFLAPLVPTTSLLTPVLAANPLVTVVTLWQPP